MSGHSDPDTTPGQVALGRLVREAWTDGPAAPSPEFLIQAIRPELARIDAEVAERPSLARTWRRIRDSFGPVPIAAMAAAGVLALLFVGPGVIPEGEAVAGAGLALRNLQSPAAIYDLDQKDKPLMIFEGKDGSTIIWILESEADPAVEAVQPPANDSAAEHSSAEQAG